VTRTGRRTTLVVGAAFGFLLTGSGLGDYRTIHEGLLLRDAYMYLMLASAMAVAAVGVALLRRRGQVLPRRPAERRHVAGAAVFGLGFGVGATCPGMLLAMVATGGAYGLVVLVGLVAGLWLRGQVERRTAQPLSTEAAPEPVDA
jgi:hypothetical protein